MRTVGALALALAVACTQEKRRMTPPATQDELHERLRRDFEGRADRPVPDRTPVRSGDGHWTSPDGSPITYSGIIAWTRPPQQDGAPLTAHYCAGEHRYWVHQGAGLGGTEFWFGPYDLIGFQRTD